MIAKQKYGELVSISKRASDAQDANIIVHEIPNTGTTVIGESNYMLLNCKYTDEQGDSVVFHYRSYDPSGPFQNLPDINKFRVELWVDGKLLELFEDSFDDPR